MGVNEKNKEKCGDLINEIFNAILNQEVYDKFVINNNNSKILNLDREFIFIINKIFKDKTFNELVKLKKKDILDKIKKLAENNFISMIAFYFIYLRFYLDDSTLGINKDTQFNILLFFMDKNNIKEYKELNDEKLEEDLLKLLKKIDSFTFEDTDKISNSYNLCKDNYSKLCDYIKNNILNLSSH